MFTSFGAALRERMLAPEEERLAIRRWQEDGDRAALETLLRSHARQVWALARRWTDNPAHLDDLVAEGMIGLIRAVENFDLGRDVRFATYSRWWVRNELSAAAGRVHAVVDVPRQARCAAVQGQVAVDVIGAEDGRDLLERMPCDDPSPEEQLLRRAAEATLHGALAAALAELPAREAAVLRRRRLSAPPVPAGQLAGELGLTLPRLRQIETRALNLLKQKLMARGFCLSALH
ncbi:sigma-70 family RNA polymerase sigma factor [Roseivivax sp. CAU 1761]